MAPCGGLCNSQVIEDCTSHRRNCKVPRILVEKLSTVPTREFTESRIEAEDELELQPCGDRLNPERLRLLFHGWLSERDDSKAQLPNRSRPVERIVRTEGAFDWSSSTGETTADKRIHAHVPRSEICIGIVLLLTKTP